MGGEEGTSNGDGTDWLKTEYMNNGFGVGMDHDCGDGSSAGSEGFQTYKRRKQARSGSESLYGRASVEAASQLANQKHWRNALLENLCQSLSDGEGGIQGCIREALTFHPEKDCTMRFKGFGAHDIDRHKSSQTEIPNGTLHESDHRTVTNMCQRVFFNIIISEKFTSLCKLLFENFQGIKVDRFFDLSVIHSRMKEGVYESSPMSFSADIQQLWGKLQDIGMEMISLAKSLADLSTTSYIDQVGGPVHDTYDKGKHEFTREPGSDVKAEQTEACGVYKVSSTCRCCGETADGRNCLVCDSCEEMYHISCIELADKDIPPKSWYCARCAKNGIGSPHENCVVCVRLNDLRSQSAQACDVISPTNEETFIEREEDSNSCKDDALQPSEGTQQCGFCKICGIFIDNGAEFRRCEHSECAYQYYHVRCLTTKQLCSYGPRWYCPSCLCRKCLNDTDDHLIVLCDGCDQAYHTYCMNPPCDTVPEGKWFCRKCDMEIQEIHRVKRLYENKQKKKGDEGGKKLNEKGEEEESDKCRGGMDMLLNAADTLNTAENLAAIQKKR